VDSLVELRCPAEKTAWTSEFAGRLFARPMKVVVAFVSDNDDEGP
jgi:hypothetical protein